MSVLKSARNGLLVGITSDTIGVVRHYALGEDNKAVFGGIRRNLFNEAKKVADKPVEIKTPPVVDVSPSPNEGTNDTDNTVLNEPAISENVVDDDSEDILPSPAPAPSPAPSPKKSGRSNKNKQATAEVEKAPADAPLETQPESELA